MARAAIRAGLTCSGTPGLLASAKVLHSSVTLLTLLRGGTIGACLTLAIVAPVVAARVPVPSDTSPVPAPAVEGPCSPVVRTLANGEPGTTDGAVQITVDGLGAFGSTSVGGQGALFDPLGSIDAAETVYSSNLYVSSLAQLLADDCDPLVSLISESPTSLVSEADFGDLLTRLEQTVDPVGAEGSRLSQRYTITNQGASPLMLALVRHLDGDLQFDGSLADGAAATADGSVLYEFDASDDPRRPSTYVGISGDLGTDATPGRWTVQPFPYSSAIVSGSGIPSIDSGVVSGDGDGDGVVDVPYDITLSQHWDVILAPGTSTQLMTVTRFGAGAPASVLGSGEPLRESVPSPAEVSLDPIVLAQSAAVAAGVVILAPFPAVLFNSTMEAHYGEIMGWLRTLRLRLGGLSAFVPLWARRRYISGGVPGTVAADPDIERRTEGGFWRSPVGIISFLLLSGLLYGLLDPTFGLDLVSVGTFLGLVGGLTVVLLAFGIPIYRNYQRESVPFFVQALPGTLLIGVACVLITRLTDFQPGYLYGLVVGFVAAREMSRADEGRTVALASGVLLAASMVAWLLLLFPIPGLAGGSDIQAVAFSTALATIVISGLEAAVFGLLPLRFLPGEKIFRWDKRIWAALLALGMFGFAHVLMNPTTGYLADESRTPFLTIVLLLAFFGLASVLFWGYFRYRSPRAEPLGSGSGSAP